MKLQINNITLIGTSRSIDFLPGFNVITGPISTGKTALMRLCRIALGSKIGSLPPEVKLIYGIKGIIVARNATIDIFRSLSSSRDAPVEIAMDDVTERLPALESDIVSSRSYGQWLIEQLALPRLEVPTAPTILESTPTPISINDYMIYCDLPKEEIRSEVFGHRNQYKDIKRRYVFRIAYGDYNAEQESLISELRTIRVELSSLRVDTGTLERLLEGTQWENRALLERNLEEAKSKAAEIEIIIKKVSSEAPGGSNIRDLQGRVRELDDKIAKNEQTKTNEKENKEKFKRLVAQLENQHSRLTRSIVANEKLIDFEFSICPRCGTSISPLRAKENVCCLC